MTKTLNEYRVKKIESIGKMTIMNQEDIMTNTKTVLQGLEALKIEHTSILNSLCEAQQGGYVEQEKQNIVRNSLESIELGMFFIILFLLIVF